MSTTLTEKPVILIGGGGHARSLMALAHDTGDHIAGIVSISPPENCMTDYYGDDSCFLQSHDPDSVCIHIAMVASHSGDMTHRRKLITQYAAYTHKSFIAPSAIITDGSEIGAGCAVMHGVIVNAATIGADTVLNTGAIIEHNCVIGSNVFIGPGAVLCGNVSVGDDVFIGAGVTVAPGICIASGTIIGMGATVINNISDSGTYVGSPAHLLPRN